MVDNAQKSEILDKVLATIHDDKGQTYAAIELNIHPSEDICVIKTDRPLLTGPASLAKRRPGRGKMVWSMMAPDGVGGTGLIPVVTGHYAGGDQRTSVFTIPAHPGASGGPILNAAGEIIGLVSQINKSFHHIVLSPSLKLLKNYVNSRVN
jgi:S1-C subfamily serine protease